MNTPWSAGRSLSAEAFAKLRRQTIFDCCKWDPQVEDISTLCNFPLLLRRSEWNFLTRTAEALASETLAAEAELVGKSALHKKLGFSRSIIKALAGSREYKGTANSLGVIRFDFHYTTEGWKISEANSDVPGGFVEASGFTALMAEQYPKTIYTNPAADLADAIASQLESGATVALVHATSFADDRQVMVFLAQVFLRKGLKTVLVAPDHLRWQNGKAFISSDWFEGPVDFVFRFFPGEWLPNLPNKCGWKYFFQGHRTPLCNPATALLTQSKRFPLIWNDLETPLPAWRKFLPATCHPKDVDWLSHEKWVLKPALGRVGESIGLTGVTSEKEWKLIRKAVHKHSEDWIAQRRFDAVPFVVDGKKYFPCLGVYTIAGRASGIYGRVSGDGLINHRAQDIAVLITDDNKF